MKYTREITEEQKQTLDNEQTLADITQAVRYAEGQIFVS